MRKDLRYGLGIGALLLAFLITFLVVRNHTHGQSDGQEQADGTVDGGPAEANLTPTVADASAASNAGASLPPLKPVTTNETAGNAKRDVFDPRPRPAGGVSASAKSSTQDWDRLLQEGTVPGSSLSLRAVEPTATGKTTTPTLADRSLPPTHTREPGRSTESSRSTGSAPVDARTGRPYTIQEGDTFVSISKTAYGSVRFFHQIELANPSVNPSRLRVGQQIVLPDLSVEARSIRGNGPFEERDNRPINARTEYRVDSGDSLYRISMKVYGTPRMIDALYEANQAAIGPNRERLKLGMILKLPQSALAQGGK